MAIMLLGGAGNMGRRYQAILSYLGVEFHVADVGHSNQQIQELAKRCAGTIITTPTETHPEFIHLLSPVKKPILCEKPVTKDIRALKDALLQVRADQTPFSMVFQYRMLVENTRLGWTHYNYFKHGNDGLAWDCIQVIGLARAQVELEEDSPIWRCTINGRALNLSDMDHAYIKFIRDWLKSPSQDLSHVLAVHEKTEAIAKEYRHVSD